MSPEVEFWRPRPSGHRIAKGLDDEWRMEQSTPLKTIGSGFQVGECYVAAESTTTFSTNTIAVDGGRPLVGQCCKLRRGHNQHQRFGGMTRAWLGVNE
ncbi:hypothetical protein O9992_27265 [Vibrio lentus]|nr:hypothetical protein [Vibrio lentus]